MSRELLPEPVLFTSEQARAYLDENPHVWPYVMTAVFGFVGLGTAAEACMLDTDSFNRLCTVANEQMAAVREAIRTGRRVEPRADLLLL